MSGILRSKQGCWSCRLRKKKCDEGQPQCLSCESLRITCYGYGPKPQWMDGGEKEQAMIEEFKRKIRLTARQKHQKPPPAVRAEPQQQRHLPVLIANRPGVADLSMTACDSNMTSGARVPEPSHARMASFSSSASDASHGHFLTSSASSPGTRASSDGGKPDSEGPSPRNLPVLAMNPRDSMLLMHYLDHVIPVQYPFYQPNPMYGGRGWLLSLLLHSKSLFHGALALSSYHRLISILANARPACRALALRRHKQNLESCLREVRCTMREMTQANSSSPDVEAGTLISVIQLVFSEASTGDLDAWRMHLRGATELYRCAMTDGDKHPKTDEALEIVRSNIPLEGEAAVLCGDVSAMRFIGSVVHWLDILGSITGGCEPRLVSMHDMDLDAGSGFRLEEVMGCQNTVMAQLGRISMLHAITEAEGTCPCEHGGPDISKTLEQSKQEAMALMREEHEPLRKKNAPISNVTVFFCHAAAIYLYFVTNGFQDSYELQQMTAEAMTYLRTEIATDMVSGLVCPLFLVACAAARTEDHDHLRAVFSSHEFLNPLFKHRARLLPILEQVWKEREEEVEHPWSRVVGLSCDILLV